MGIELKSSIVRTGEKKGQRIMSGKQNTEEDGGWVVLEGRENSVL